ncbi:hypothetical protein [Rhizobium sp. RU36D]|uniref:hypothetical protein n=1 Tax=Rhizobium sp. RU36D TaxID=1907415 RepID=UPI0009D861DD|nr:hypothetical protein [Rhizobium sp. RU36D]SMD18552.1 hypothetical protein SAMN05880593_13528 [Rhizobium sp. RU36D]
MKKIGIEELLTWAFTVELPKVSADRDWIAGLPSIGFASASGMLTETLALGTIIDRSPNAFGVIPCSIDTGEAHPDAMRVGDAVRGLGDMAFEIGEGWAPFPEWEDPHGVIAPEIASIAAGYCARDGRVNGRHIFTLVTTCAVLMKRPDWTADQPEVVVVTNNGNPAWFVKRYAKDRMGRSVPYEDNGYDVKRQRPVKGAYRKYRINGSIRAAVVGRIEWQLWQHALLTLRDALAGKLEGHDLLPFTPRMEPWRGSQNPAPISQAIESAA